MSFLHTYFTENSELICEERKFSGDLISITYNKGINVLCFYDYFSTKTVLLQVALPPNNLPWHHPEVNNQQSLTMCYLNLLGAKSDFFFLGEGVTFSESQKV